MITRLSKIARLPANIREQINHRLHDGELSRTIVPWVNELPETKKVIAELYRGKPITHQNLSEWRHTGYQDWLQHQQRLEWNGRLAEEETEVNNQNRCADGYEAMGFQFLYEIAQALKAMQKIKNPNHRWERLETLTREFARLQNAFNWSRRVCLEFDKFKLAHSRIEPGPDHSGTGVSPVSPCSHGRDARATTQMHNVPVSSACGSTGLSSPECKSPVENLNSQAPAPETPSSFCILPSALPNAGGASVPTPAPPKHSEGGSRANVETTAPEITEAPVTSVPNSSTPKPLNSKTPLLLSSLTPTPLRALPPLSPPTPPTPKSHYRTPRPPIRGRRFVCIEG